MKTTKCNSCGTDIRNCNLSKHIKACDGNYKPFKKSTNCPHCLINLLESSIDIPNHIRWCHQNPKRNDYVKNQNCKQMQTPEAIAKRREGIKKAHADGKYDHVERGTSFRGKHHTEETKRHLREKALSSPHRRLVRSIRQYTKKDGTVVILDSSWEEALAIRLDEIGVNWVRPGAIKWVDDNSVTHNYFPDFYLIDFDLYLDPKNPYAIKAQQSKIKCLTEQIKNLVILKGLDECKNYTPLQSGQNIF